jgi:hypothetical protein
LVYPCVITRVGRIKAVRIFHHSGVVARVVLVVEVLVIFLLTTDIAQEVIRCDHRTHESFVVGIHLCTAIALSSPFAELQCIGDETTTHVVQSPWITSRFLNGVAIFEALKIDLAEFDEQLFWNGQ